MADKSLLLIVNEKTLNWNDTEAIQAKIKEYGVKQLLLLFEKFKNDQ